MATAAAPPDADGWCSLSLHAGSTYGELAADRRGPRSAADRRGLRALPTHPRLRARLPARPPRRPDRRPGRERQGAAAPRGPAARATPSARSPSTPAASSTTARRSRPGIGAIPSTIAGLLAEGDGGDYGVHSEMFTTGPHAAARGREGHQPRRASSTASRSRPSPAAPRSSTSGSTTTPTSPSCRSRSSTRPT